MHGIGSCGVICTMNCEGEHPRAGWDRRGWARGEVCVGGGQHQGHWNELQATGDRPRWWTGSIACCLSPTTSGEHSWCQIKRFIFLTKTFHKSFSPFYPIAKLLCPFKGRAQAFPVWSLPCFMSGDSLCRFKLRTTAQTCSPLHMTRSKNLRSSKFACSGF